MGTTAEKLSYLNETKTKIKNSLETPSNTFRDYPDLIKKYIDNQPTKVVSDGVCDNAVDLPIKGMGIDGNYEQKTTDGRQLFDNTLKGYGHYGYTVKTITNGIRITAENDFIKGDALFGVYTIIDLSNYIGKVVRMQADIIPNKSTGAGTYRLGLSNKDSTNRKALAETGTKKEISFTVPELTGEQKYLAIWFYIGTTNSGTKGDYTDYTNIIVTIDNDDMTYAEYTGGIPSPNPNYEQDIEVIDGCNRFDETEILKAEGWTKNSEGYYKGSFLKWNNAFDTKTSGFTIKGGFRVNTQYILLFKGYVSGGTASFRIKYDDETFSNYLFSNTSEELHTIISTAGKNVVGLYGTYTSGGGNTLYVKNVQFIEGTALKPYLPHGTIGLEQSGKNKVDFINYAEKVFDSSKVEKLDDGSYKFKHADGSYPLYEGLLKPPCILSFWAKNDTGETIASYTFSFKIFYEDGTYDRVSMITNGNFARKEFKINKNVIKIANTYTITKPYTIIKDVQLEEGSIATSYEPYHETKVIPIDLQRNTLARVGDIKDKLIIHRNGEVELMKNIWKKNISITSIIEDSGTKMAVVGASGKKRNNRTLNTGLCTKAIMTKGNPLYNGTFYENATNFVFVGANEDTLETMKSKYDNAELYYQLETPQIIKLPSINPIDLWQGTNIFKLITNLETNFEVEYVVDKDSMLDEVQTAMLNAEIEI